MIAADKLLVLGLVLGLAGCGEVKSDAASGDDPTIASLAPDHGPADGGIMVTITGTNFSGDAPIVVVDGVAATDAAVASATSLTFKLPPGLEGHVVDIEVSTDHGFAVMSQAFRYNLRPVVLGITPKFGRFAGGTSVTITGRGFQIDEAEIPTIMLGGSAATSVQLIDDKTLIATTAPADPAQIAFVPTDVVVTNKNGTGPLTDGFTLTKQGMLVITRTNTGNGGGQFYVDPAAKTAVQLPQMAAKIGGCALAPNGKVFSHVRNQSLNTFDLVDFDPIARTVNVDAANMVEGANHPDITSMGYVGNTLYVLSQQQGRMYSVNQSTGALTGIGAANNAAFQGRQGIAVKDGSNLWQAKSTVGTLNTVNVSTGAVTVGPAFTNGDGGEVHGMVTIGGVLYLASFNTPGTIFSVNTTTGALTQVASIPSQVKGICQTPAAF